MTIDNTSNSLNPLPLLSEEMERTLRLRAWRDEIFREALIADPKGVIQYMFHQSLPNGKLPDNQTINVIEQDPFTHHIVLPALANEEPILEIAEENQLELLVNMGEINWKPREIKLPKNSSGEKKKDEVRRYYEAKQTSQEQKSTNESLPKTDAKIPTRDQFQTALSSALKDKTFRQVLDTDPMKAMKLLYDKSFPDHKMPEGIDVKLLQNTRDTHHIVLASLPDASQNPEEQLDHIANMIEDNCKKQTAYLTQSGCSENCQLTGSGPNCPDVF